MDYHLEKEIRLNNKTEHEGLYSWCLQEFNGKGEQVSSDLIPWDWSFHFTASEFRLYQGIEFGELSLLGDEQPEDDKKFEDREFITATLHPGICDDGVYLEDDTRFSMFGTDRTITEFTLRIHEIDDEEREGCKIWGGVSYTSEVDFRDETEPDIIQIYLGLSKERYKEIAHIILNKSVDVARVGLNKVSGFYSDWSPSISTNSVKVLTRSNDHEVIKPDGCDIEPPRLGEVGEFDLTLITRCKLNPKQNLNSIKISKLFENDLEVYEEEEVVEEKEDPTNILLTQIVANQNEINKIKKPLWLVVILLTILLLTIWI